VAGPAKIPAKENGPVKFGFRILKIARKVDLLILIKTNYHSCGTIKAEILAVTIMKNGSYTKTLGATSSLPNLK